MIEVLPAALTWALFGAGIAFYAIACVDPGLRSAGATTMARIAGAAISALAVGLVSLAGLIGRPEVPLSVALAMVVLLVIVPSAWLVRLSGGPQWSGQRGEIARRVGAAYARNEAGDVDGWRREILNLSEVADAESAAYVAALQAWAHDVSQGAPARNETSARLRHEHRLLFIGRGPSRWVVALIVATAGLATGVPVYSTALARHMACDEAERITAAIVPEAGSPGIETARLVVSDPVAGARLVSEGRVDLEAAVESRVDPNTERQLRDAGFIEAYQRTWQLDDGFVSADAFAFASPEGAIAFHRDVTRYACQFALTTFSPGDGAVGLRIRYATDPPIRDQIAWIHGHHRVLVSIGYSSSPFGHDDILRLYEIARELRPSDPDPGSLD